jgi:hypothetical protein
MLAGKTNPVFRCVPANLASIVVNVNVGIEAYIGINKDFDMWAVCQRLGNSKPS